jgi:hypothetical protein
MTKSYDKACARMVQEALGTPYTVALRLVQEDQAKHPEAMPKETRALRILEAKEKP